MDRSAFRELFREPDNVVKISAANAKNKAARWFDHIPSERGQLNCIVGLPGRDFRTLTRPELVLDAATIEQHISSMARPLGAIEPQKAVHLRDRATRYLAGRTAHLHAAALSMPPDRLADAIYFALMAEVCSVLPLRHVARQIARIADRDPVLIPLRSLRGTYLGYWRQSSLEHLILAAEINRAGGQALLVLDAGQAATWHARLRGFFQLRFTAHHYWRVPQRSLKTRLRTPRLSEPAPGAVAVLAGIRNPRNVLQQIGAPRVVEASVGVNAAEHHDKLTQDAPRASSVTLRFERQLGDISADLQSDTHAGRHGSLQHFTCQPPHWGLTEWLSDTVGPRLAAMSARADQLVRDQSLSDAHVCDHLFAESALIAHAVTSQGGRTALWPHSANAVHVDARRSAEPNRIVVVTRSAATAWRGRYPHSKIELQPSLMFGAAVPSPAYLKDVPVTVVVITGAHALLRLPLLDLSQHQRLYRELLANLHAAGDTVRVVVKAKRPWETMDWLQQQAPVGLTLNETHISPTKIDVPNAIFLTVSLASSALLEGMSRGIPGMIVRQAPVVDYVAIDSGVVPTGSPDAIAREIKLCGDADHYHDLSTRQRAWFDEETSQPA